MLMKIHQLLAFVKIGACLLLSAVPYHLFSPMMPYRACILQGPSCSIFCLSLPCSIPSLSLPCGIPCLSLHCRCVCSLPRQAVISFSLPTSIRLLSLHRPQVQEEVLQGIASTQVIILLAKQLTYRQIYGYLEIFQDAAAQRKHLRIEVISVNIIASATLSILSNEDTA